MDDGNSAAAPAGSAVTGAVDAAVATRPENGCQGLIASSWTDEMHDFYLNSMEATFVHRLYSSEYGSSDVHDAHSHPRDYIASKSDANSSRNDQFKVHRDGCWGNRFFRKDTSVDLAGETPALASNLWIQRFRSSQAKSAEVRVCEEFVCSNSNQPMYQHLCCRDIDWSNAEVTDQNFIDEDTESPKLGSSKRKRMRNKIGDSK